MATIQGGKPAPEVTDRINSVLSVTEAKFFAISLTDDSGRKGTALVVSFGKEKDGRPFVGLLMNNVEMQSSLRIAAKDVREAVIRRLSAGTAAVPAEPLESSPLLDVLSGQLEEPKPKRGKKKGA